jgi:hypothetical protein
MAGTTPETAPLTFERFWRWLMEHPNCVLRAGSFDAVFFDSEAFHWDFFEEDDGRAVAQLILGKNLVGELIIERANVLFVQAAPDKEDPKSGAWVFELIGGNKEDSYPQYHFVLSHGMENVPGHTTLKH